MSKGTHQAEVESSGIREKKMSLGSMETGRAWEGFLGWAVELLKVQIASLEVEYHPTSQASRNEYDLPKSQYSGFGQEQKGKMSELDLRDHLKEQSSRSRHQTAVRFPHLSTW